MGFRGSRVQIPPSRLQRRAEKARRFVSCARAGQASRMKEVVLLACNLDHDLPLRVSLANVPQRIGGRA
jgi:hypothetical protein